MQPTTETFRQEAPRPTEAEREQYLTTFQRLLSRLLAGRTSGHVLDDVVQFEMLRLFEKLDVIMAAYPDPMALASARGTGGRALIDHVRRDNVQSGRGALGTRTVVNGDDHFVDMNLRRQPATDSNGIEIVRSCFEVADERRARRCVDDRLHAALLQLPRLQRAVVVLVDLYGYSVTDAAVELGVVRETAARKHSAALRALRTVLRADGHAASANAEA